MYKQIIIAACIIHQKKGTSVRITFLLLHIVSTSLKSYSPSMNEGMYTSVVELSRLMSKPIQDSSFHFIVIAISVAPESFFHWTKVCWQKHGYTILNLNLKGDQWNGVTQLHQGPKSLRPKSLLAKSWPLVFGILKV